MAAAPGAGPEAGAQEDAKIVAGWDWKSPFVGSADGNFLLRAGARIQFRLVANQADGAGTPGAPTDKSESGFEMRRTRLKLYGHAFRPELRYYVETEFNRNGGALILKQSWIAYDLNDRHFLQVGLFKSNFLHEEQVSDGSQATVERSNMNEFFTLDYSEGVQIGGTYKGARWWVAVHDGRENETTGFPGDTTEFGANGRFAFRPAGTGKQFKDFAAWSSDPFGLQIGVGIDYEKGETGSNGGANWDYMINYTADVSLELHPFSLFAAFAGRFVSHDLGAGGLVGDDYSQSGFVAQASVFLRPDKWDVFARWEHIDFDGAAELTGKSNVAALGPLGTGVDDEQSILTVGTNYYFKKHKAKLTVDGLWAPDGIRQGESGGDNRTSNLTDDDQFGLRVQLQLQF